MGSSIKDLITEIASLGEVPNAAAAAAAPKLAAKVKAMGGRRLRAGNAVAAHAVASGSTIRVRGVFVDPAQVPGDWEATIREAVEAAFAVRSK